MHFLRRLDCALGRDCHSLKHQARFWLAGSTQQALSSFVYSERRGFLGAADPVPYIDQWYDYGTFNHDAGQTSGREGSGVNINPI
jgi:hypothetical protein